MDKNTIIGGIVILIIGYLSTTEWGFEIFYKVFGNFSMVATYGLFVLGILVIGIGLMRVNPIDNLEDTMGIEDLEGEDKK